VKEQSALQLERSCSKWQGASGSEWAQRRICSAVNTQRKRRSTVHGLVHAFRNGRAAIKSPSLNSITRIITITSSWSSLSNFHKADAFVVTFLAPVHRPQLDVHI
jgi:hypothetical protein